MSQSANEADWSVFEQEDDLEASPEYEYFSEQAQFCLATGFVQPSEYDLMNNIQMRAWIDALNQRK